MLALPYEHAKTALEALEGRVEGLLELAGRDELSAFLCLLVLAAAAGRVEITSPWIEDLELLIPPPLAAALGVPCQPPPCRARLTDLLSRACEQKEAKVVIVTRGGKRDQYPDAAKQRALLAAHLPACAEYRIDEGDRVHTKEVIVELEGVELRAVLTANLTEPELCKVRSKDNRIAIEAHRKTPAHLEESANQ